MDRWQPTQIANLQEIGSFLQGQREQQNLTLQMVSETTHIRSGVLQSLESGQVNSLPEPVYLRALLKRYGEFLGFQGQAILDRLDDKRPPLAEAPPFQPMQSRPSPAAVESSGAVVPPPIVGLPRLSTLQAVIGPSDDDKVVLPNAKPVALGGSGGTAPELGTPQAFVAPPTLATPVALASDPAPTPSAAPAANATAPSSPRPTGSQPLSTPQSGSPLPGPQFPAFGVNRDVTRPAPGAAERQNGTPAAGSVAPMGPTPTSPAPAVTTAAVPPEALPTSPATEPAPTAVALTGSDRPLPPPIVPLSLTPPAPSTPWSVMQPLVLGVGAVAGLVLLAWGLPQVLTSRSGGDPAGTLGTTSTNAAAPLNAPTAASGGQTATDAPAATAPPAVTAQPSPAASANTLPLTLVLSVRGGTSWVRATVDGTVAYEGLLENGSQQSWTAQQSLNLVVGRSDLVWVAINGLPAKVLGDEPNPKQQTFPDPSPDPSPTPSN